MQYGGNIQFVLRESGEVGLCLMDYGAPTYSS